MILIICHRAVRKFLLLFVFKQLCRTTSIFSWLLTDFSEIAAPNAKKRIHNLLLFLSTAHVPVCLCIYMKKAKQTGERPFPSERLSPLSTYKGRIRTSGTHTRALSAPHLLFLTFLCLRALPGYSLWFGGARSHTWRPPPVSALQCRAINSSCLARLLCSFT